MAIAGSLLELFSKVEEVGSDVRFIGSVGAPSLLFSEINISGI
ncbi:MAG TPA: metallopeptidase TldD-related protein [Thermodesulfobacteriota bacterium]|nr:metallopeptidase TldD-related protein [Thermodesulfobacteriota bacterium]